MTHQNLRRRLAVSAVAATTAAAGLAVLAPGASAAATERIIITPSTQNAAAGTCVVYTLQPLDAAGVQATDSDTATVSITESPNSGTQDVDFCTVSGTTADTTGPASASYTNANEGVGPLVQPARSQSYAPGPTVTSTSSGSDQPDTAANTQPATPDGTTAVDNTNNPSGVDTAQFRYTGNVIRFGVVGLVPGGATIRAFIDRGARNGVADPGEPVADAAATFREGGLPGTAAAADAAKSVDAEPETGSGQQGSLQTFTTVVRNGTGDTLFGVRPLVQVVSGANVAAADTLRADCSATNNAGVATCVFQGAKIGTDTLRVFVQQTAGGTAGPDASEPFDEIVRSTTLRAEPRANARFVDLTPATTTTPAGTSKVFTAAVSTASGAPATGVSLIFTEDGPGRFSNGQSTVEVVTGDDGIATATVTTVAAESLGNQIVTTAIVNQGSTQCTQPAATGTGATTTTPAGSCSDSSVNTVTAPPSPSPSPASTTSPSASPSATPSRSATPTATASPSASPSSSPSASPARVRPVLTLPRSIITSQEQAEVVATAEPGSVVELQAYSRPSTTYVIVRRAVVGESGRVVFRVGPSGNTRMFLRSRDIDSGSQVDSASIVLTVRTSLNLKVARVGTQTYRFTGSTLPKRRGQLVTVFYQADGGNRVIASRARVAQDGTYNVTRRFGGRGTFTLFTGTGTDINNAANNSRPVRTTIR